MAKVNLKMPYFCRGTQAQLEAALEEGGIFENLDRIVWCYVTGGDNIGSLLFVDPEKQIHEISEAQLAALDERITALESVIDEHETTMGTIKATQEEQAVVIVNLDERMTAAETTIAGLNDSVNSLNDAVSNIETNIETLTTDVANLNDSKADKATTLAGYGITDAYTSAEIDSKLGDLEGVNVTEYVINASTAALNEAKEYAESLSTDTYEEI